MDQNMDADERNIFGYNFASGILNPAFVSSTGRESSQIDVFGESSASESETNSLNRSCNIFAQECSSEPGASELNRSYDIFNQAFTPERRAGGLCNQPSSFERDTNELDSSYDILSNRVCRQRPILENSASNQTSGDTTSYQETFEADTSIPNR